MWRRTYDNTYRKSQIRTLLAPTLPEKKWRRISIMETEVAVAPLADNCALIDLEATTALGQIKPDNDYLDCPTCWLNFYGMIKISRLLR